MSSSGSFPTESADPMVSGLSPGMILGGFKLVARIGVGGMGEVWRAHNAKIERMVRAIKVIRTDLSADGNFAQRFLREAEYLETLQHPNILRVENLGEDAGRLFMVMELLQGEGVDTWLVDKTARGSLPSVGEACNILVQAIAGVELAHANGIVHRDLKPPNLFLTTTGIVKILDFGIARGVGGGPTLTMTGQAVPGSPAYYAPEFAEGASASDKSDVYALGVTLFELLTGRWPFLPGGGTDGQGAISIMVQHVTKPMPDIREHRDGLPAPVVDAVMGACMKRPQDRPTAAAMRELIAPFVTMIEGREGSGPVLAGHLMTPVRGVDPTSSGHTPATPSMTPHAAPLLRQHTASERSGRSRQRRLLAVATGAITGLVFAVAILVMIIPVVTDAGRRRATATTTSTSSSPTRDAAPHAAPVAPAPPRPTPVVPDGMIAFEGGDALIGAADGAPLDGPPHIERIEPFAIDRLEVSIGDVRKFVESGAPGSKGIALPSLRTTLLDGKPMVRIDQRSAQAYCAWARPGGRLPTEIEWEYAARGAQGSRRYPWGSTFDPACANVDKGEDGVLARVGTHGCGATPEGVLDLAGNAAEWTSTKATLYPGSSQQLPAFARGGYVVRGGSMASANADVTTTRRQFAKSASPYIGFRCAAPSR